MSSIQAAHAGTKPLAPAAPALPASLVLLLASGAGFAVAALY